MKRGDVVLVRFPHPSGQRGKKRPAVVEAVSCTLELLDHVFGQRPVKISRHPELASAKAKGTWPDGVRGHGPDFREGLFVPDHEERFAACHAT